ncbi:hypothetical protein [Serratia sp. DD3]|uniref:hypothetical protein n=1 Tax=Serratia sp. DD3 TaxID=1410619 RepID=UPI0003C50BAF|nr:hypothetical protein [Serratia sp. DD3]KEY57619.1 hypothetical protein SRDD_34570 [Serratia sp. DD3]
MRKIAFTLIVSALSLSNIVHAKTEWNNANTGGGALGDLHAGNNWSAGGVIDKCVIVAPIKFTEVNADEYSTVFECRDFDDPRGIIYRFSAGSWTREEMLEGKRSPEKRFTVGQVSIVKFTASVKIINDAKELLYIDFSDKFYAPMVKHLMSLKTLEAESGKKMSTKTRPMSSVTGRILTLMQWMRPEYTNGPAFLFEDAPPPVANGKKESPVASLPSPTGTGAMRNKTLSDVMESMLGQSMATIKKTMDNPDKVNTVGDKTELVWQVSYGFAGLKSCVQHFYFSRGVDKAVAWYHDCPQSEGNYGKISATTPVPTGKRF